MEPFGYRVEETTVRSDGAADQLTQLLNDASAEWELFSIDHLRDDAAGSVFLLVWRQPKPFGDLTEESGPG